MIIIEKYDFPVFDENKKFKNKFLDSAELLEMLSTHFHIKNKFGLTFLKNILI